MSYTEQLKWFYDELDRLSTTRDAIDARTDRVLEIIGILSTLAETEEDEIVIPPLTIDSEDGFTDRVRHVLRSIPRAMTAMHVRNALLAADPEKKDSKTILIHTHNTLKRLVKQEEVDEMPAVDGRTAYKWKFTGEEENVLHKRIFGRPANTGSTGEADESVPRRVFLKGPTMVDALAKVIEDNRREKED